MRRKPIPAPGLTFWKLEGAGNDFVLVDEGASPMPTGPRAPWIRDILDRRRGVGGDGLLLLSRNGPRPRVRYWNADGGRAAYCGNGARVVARFLLDDAGAMDSLRFDFGRRQLLAKRGIGPGRIQVLTPRPRRRVLPARLRLPATQAVALYDAGVPHLLLHMRGIAEQDLAALAPPLRRAPAFGSAGTNVDLVEIRRGRLHVRTWERGVEGETEACGSGLLAAATWAMEERRLTPPILLESRGGDLFRVAIEGDDLWLEGPTRVVCRGTLLDPPRAASSRRIVASSRRTGS